VIFHENVVPFSSAPQDQSMIPAPPIIYDKYFNSLVLTPTLPEHAVEDTDHEVLPIDQESTPQQVRRTTRNHRTPSYLNDYVCTTHRELHCKATLTNNWISISLVLLKRL